MSVFFSVCLKKKHGAIMAQNLRAVGNKTNVRQAMDSLIQARDNQNRGTETVPQVLIVDDEALVCWSLQSAFQKAGIQTTTVASGEKALDKIETCQFDLVITDMKLPRMDGFAVAAAARRAFPQTPILMISAFGDAAARQKAKSVSIDYFIDKPFDVGEITHFVIQLLRHRSKETT